MAINLTSQTELSSLFVAEQVTDANGSLQTTPKPTTVVVDGVTVPVDVIAEFQASSGGILIPRVTSTVREAMNVVDGTIVFDTTAVSFFFKQSNAWVALSNGEGDGGNVSNNSGASEVNAIAIWSNGLGTTISSNTNTNANNVLLDNQGNFTRVNTIKIADNNAAAPSYSFTSDATTGIYKSAGSIIGFASNGALNLSVGNAAANVVNHLAITGSVTGSSPKIASVGADANPNLFLQAKGTGNVTVIATPGNTAAGALLLQNAAGSFAAGFSGAGVTANTIYALPGAVPTVGQVLSAAAPVAGVSQLSWSAAGTVSVNGVQTTNAIVTFNATANEIQSGALLIDAEGVVTQNGVDTAVVQLSDGAADAPTYTFANSLTCGMYLSADNVIGFAADSTPHLKVGAALTAVNFLEVIGSLTTEPVIIKASGADTDVNLALYYKGAGSVKIASINDGGPAVLELLNTAADNSISLTVDGALASTVAYTLPAAPDADGKIMSSTMAGVMSWVAPTSLGQYLVTQVTITNAQLLALYDTPIQLIAAIADTAIKVVDMTFELVYGSVALATGGEIFAQYGNGAHPASLASAATIGLRPDALYATQNTIYNVSGVLQGAGVASTGVIGAGVFLTNLTGNFTNGTDSTLIVTLGYYLITGLS